MARVHFVKKARKDVPNSDIKKGDSYFWWKHKFGSKQVSKTHPKPSQLTQSEFLGAIYDIQDRIEALTVDDDLGAEVEGIVGELESLRDDCENKRDNMPEQLQDSGSGEMLQNRSDSVQEMIDELEAIDCEPEEIDIEDEELKDEFPKEPDETMEDYKDRLEEEAETKNNDAKQEVLDEIHGVSYNGE
jgi:hypothetical protein